MSELQTLLVDHRVGVGRHTVRLSQTRRHSNAPDDDIAVKATLAEAGDGLNQSDHRGALEDDVRARCHALRSSQ
jgi:hypothetical protein